MPSASSKGFKRNELCCFSPLLYLSTAFFLWKIALWVSAPEITADPKQVTISAADAFLC